MSQQIAALESQLAGQSETLQASVHSQEAAVASECAAKAVTHDLSLRVAADSALVSGLSVRIDVLERGKESDLAQLSEKLNGVEEKQWDEQVALSQQIAALESQLAGQAEPASA